MEKGDNTPGSPVKKKPKQTKVKADKTQDIIAKSMHSGPKGMPKRMGPKIRHRNRGKGDNQQQARKAKKGTKVRQNRPTQQPRPKVSLGIGFFLIVIFPCETKKIVVYLIVENKLPELPYKVKVSHSNVDRRSSGVQVFKTDDCCFTNGPHDLLASPKVLTSLSSKTVLMSCPTGRLVWKSRRKHNYVFYSGTDDKSLSVQGCETFVCFIA